MSKRFVTSADGASRSPASEARALLEAIAVIPRQVGTRVSREERAKLSEVLAEALCAQTVLETRAADRTRAAMLARLMNDRAGQAFTTALTDRLFRSTNAARVSEELAYLLDRYGVPSYLRRGERALLKLAKGARKVAPRLVARGAEARVREETRAVLLSSSADALARHVAARHAEGVRVNVNKLGEALLGEDEAERRVQAYEALARQDGIDALSVKVSSIGSQVNLLAFEETVSTLAARLARIYQASLREGRGRGPLVMLDMEAYQDLELTFAVLERALVDRALAPSSLEGVRAGVVLQAYLPDANAYHRRLLGIAAARRARGGNKLHLRIVKGANLAHERVESAKSRATLPILASKRDVDANYKRLLERAIQPRALEDVELGVASHNLFDVAYALILAREAGALVLRDPPAAIAAHEETAPVSFEMLEGMAEASRRALGRLGVEVLVYAPVCRDDEMNTGIAYLVRRLDENTADDNFLRSSFGMRPGDASFAKERRRFREAIAAVDTIEEAPRRRLDPGWQRAEEEARGAPAPAPFDAPFQGAEDTDFAHAENRHWIEGHLARRQAGPAPLLVSSIAGEDGATTNTRDGVDPSRPAAVPYRVALASEGEVRRAIACAAGDPHAYARTSVEERARRLASVQAGLRAARGALVSAMVQDGGKRVVEADVEVSEAIDFAGYYRASFLASSRTYADDVSFTPRGVVLVAPPWNFPLAIPAGGVLAALMAGNRVLFKPALETALVGAELARIFWEAGVPREVLQLVLVDDDAASLLVRDARVDAVVLTGGTDTARRFQTLRPGLRLLAETGGKNAYVVSAMSDRELAIRDAVASAFGHAGQKCSAASLLVCEAEVYDDPAFLETLRDAVTSLAVGSAWEPASFVTPLIHPPEGPLARALDTLDEGERWLVAPRRSEENPCLVSPGVKLGVRPGSFTHRTELFGPVLGVMRADSLEHAIALANATGYGLTAGLASLDEREQARFTDGVRAGNVYVNRTTTGAVVERQPFGGVAKSGFGPGAKAGGPNYVAQLAHVRDRASTTCLGSVPPLAPALEAWLAALLGDVPVEAHERHRLERRLASYARAAREHFAIEHELQKVLGQRNVFRYRPARALALRASADAHLGDLVASLFAAAAVGAPLAVSLDPALRPELGASSLDALARAGAVLTGTFEGHAVTREPLEALLARARTVSRLRILGARPAALDAWSAETGAHLADEPLVSQGRFELLHYVEEQSLCIEEHRYGHLPTPATERLPAR